MSYFEDCNYEIAQLRAAIRECYTQSMHYEEEGDTVNANIYLTQAGDLHEELRAALDYREQCRKDCTCFEDCSTCEKPCRLDPTDMDQSYQLDVLLNEMNVMAGQIEYLQDENDRLQDELKDAEDSFDNLLVKLRSVEQSLADTSKRAADYWKRIKTLENSND